MTLSRSIFASKETTARTCSSAADCCDGVGQCLSACYNPAGLCPGLHNNTAGCTCATPRVHAVVAVDVQYAVFDRCVGVSTSFGRVPGV